MYPENEIVCETAEILISRRIDGELDAADLPGLERHLTACGACREHYDNWKRQTQSLNTELESLWPAPRKSALAAAAVQSRSAPARAVLRLQRRVWLPVGMAASQIVAFVGLSVYVLFFGQSAQAPQREGASRPDLAQIAGKSPDAVSVPDAPAAARSSVASAVANDRTAPAITVHAGEADVVELPEAIVAAEPQAPEQLAAVEGKPGEAGAVAPKYDLASLGEPEIPELVPGLRLDYCISTPDGRAETGRVFVLGNVLSGRAVLRVLDSSGRAREVAQADIDALISEPLRGTIQRFIGQCQRPEVQQQLKDRENR